MTIRINKFSKAMMAFQARIKPRSNGYTSKTNSLDQNWLNYFLREVKLAMGIKNIMLFYPATDVCSVVYSVLSLVTCTVDFFQRTREIKECTAPTHTIRGRV